MRGHGRKTKGVETLLGDPKKAIVKLSIPIILAMSVNSVYNLVDAIWVAGLGADALAAVGFFFPFLFITMAVSTGIGVGASSAISRAIGAKDHEAADKVGMHTMVLVLLLSVAFTIPFLIFVQDIFVAIGAGATAGMATQYGRVMFSGTIIFFFANIGMAILRGEGDATRSMWAMVLGAGLNIVLDPIFIYTLDMGVVGAAWATLVSISVTAVLMFYWLFVKKDTFVTYRLRGIKLERPVFKEILRVGLPASALQLSMSIMMIILNLLIVYVGGTDGVAIHTTGWRIAMIAVLPLLGISTGVTAVTGAAYGARAFAKLKAALLYSVKVGLVIEATIGTLTFIFAPQIVSIFTYSEGAAGLADGMVVFLRAVVLFYPGVAFGMMASSTFMGTGHAMKALTVTLIRTVVLTPPFCILFAITWGMGLPGIWYGIVVGNLTGSLIAFVWGYHFVSKLDIEAGAEEGSPAGGEPQ